MSNAVFELTWYEKEGDKFIGSVPLKDLNLADLRNLLDLSSDDPMPYIYPVKRTYMSFLNNFVNAQINLDVYDYFIEKIYEEM